MSTTFMSTHPNLPPTPGSSTDDYVDADTLRSTFALAMSAMYKAEVPLYGDLVRIVQQVNQDVRARDAAAASSLSEPSVVGVHHDSPQRLSLERHGAIRLGTPHELHTARRIFALMGMHPVGYYDLSIAGLPMHATCFRPTTAAALETNPFRVFTTLLRPDLLTSPTARALSQRLLSRRQIFSAALLALLDTAEAQQQAKLTAHQGEQLVTEALRSFSWQPVAAATHAEYTTLRDEGHPILADIACFRSAHINHLTPRALDIVAAQRAMVAGGLRVKERIEGPPGGRRCPILLRQTSFLALEERIRFPTSAEGEETLLVEGQHKARFGEIEERGAAVTVKGRRLYDELLEESMRTAGERDLDSVLAEVFEAKYPDDWDVLRTQGLIYCEYRCEEGARDKLAALDLSKEPKASLLDRLVREGILAARPITYEDFLPFSAAGIFQSNLQTGNKAAGQPVAQVGADRDGYEKAMDCPALDADVLYADMQRRTLEKCAAELGLGIEDVSVLL